MKWLIAFVLAAIICLFLTGIEAVAILSASALFCGGRLEQPHPLLLLAHLVVLAVITILLRRYVVEATGVLEEIGPPEDT